TTSDTCPRPLLPLGCENGGQGRPLPGGACHADEAIAARGVLCSACRVFGQRSTRERCAGRWQRRSDGLIAQEPGASTLQAMSARRTAARVSSTAVGVPELCSVREPRPVPRLLNGI